MIETSSDLLRSSSAIFGNLRQSLVIYGKCSEIFGKCSETFVQHSGQFWKTFRNLRKMVGNLRKIVLFYIIKKNYMVAWRYEIYLLMLKNISLVRCAHSWNIFQHSKINFVSPRCHVISSIYYMLKINSLSITYQKISWIYLTNKEA